MTIRGHVYAIIDPREPDDNGPLGSFFYIGITLRTIYDRLDGHISGAKKYKGNNLYKERKIRKIIDAGLYPQVVSLQEALQENLKYLERFYIKNLRLFGAILTNISDGGDFNPMTDLSPEKIVAMKESAKLKNKSNFRKKVEEKCKELGISVEQYPNWKLDQHIKRRQARLDAMTDEDRRINALEVKARRDKLRGEMGDKLFKELVAKERREWFNGLSEERKEEQRQKESVYCKTRRSNETPEQKIARRAKVTAKRRIAKQKLIEEIGIEAYRQLERDKRSTWSPRGSAIKQKSGRKPGPQYKT